MAGTLADSKGTSPEFRRQYLSKPTGGTSGPRASTPGERRRIVLGAAEGAEAGPEGIALGAAHAAKKQTPARQRESTGSQKQNLHPERTANRNTRVKITPNLTGSASGGLILIEFLAGALIIGSSLFTKGSNKGYVITMSEILVRLSALTAVFFVLFLVGGSKNAGKAAAWFGLLIDIGILFNAVQETQISSLADIIRGQGTGVDGTTLVSATTVEEPKPSVQLPDE
jgi:hypothetical protein